MRAAASKRDHVIVVLMQPATVGARIRVYAVVNPVLSQFRNGEDLNGRIEQTRPTAFDIGPCLFELAFRVVDAPIAEDLSTALGVILDPSLENLLGAIGIFPLPASGSHYRALPIGQVPGV